MSNLSCCCANLSREESTDELWLLEGENRTAGIIIAVVLCVYILVGVPANVFIIVSVVKHKLYQQPGFLPLLNLAITDLLICMVVMLMNTVSGIAGTFPFGSSDQVRCQFCKLTSVVVIAVYYSSIFSVTLVSMDRFVFIKWPLRYEVVVTASKMVLALVFIWLLSIVISLPPLFGFGQFYFSKIVATCTVDFGRSGGYLLFVVVITLIPVCILIVTNVWLVVIVQRQLRQVYRLYKSCTSEAQKQQFTSELNSKIKSKRNRKELNLIRVFVTIFFANVFTLLPVIALSIASVFVGIANVGLGYAVFSHLVWVAQFVLHPLLEMSIVSEIKQPLLRAWHKCGPSLPEASGPSSSGDHVPQGEQVPRSGKRCCCRCGFLKLWVVAVLPQSTVAT